MCLAPPNPMSKPRSLAQAIARTRFYLRFVPSAFARQALILARLRRETDSFVCGVHLHDPLDRFLSGVIWPLPSPRFLKTFFEVNPTYDLLQTLNEIYEQVWDARPGVATPIPDSLLRESLLYRYVLVRYNYQHVAFYPYPVRTNGDQVTVFLTRAHGSAAFGERELRIAGEICSAFAPELNAFNSLDPRTHRTYAASLSEHTVELDADFRPAVLPLYPQALLARFYGGQIPTAADGRLRLPPALETELRRYRGDTLRAADVAGEGFAHSFSKAYRGRILCLVLHTLPGGAFRLTLHEDQSQFDRLRRIMAACRALPRDRTSVFSSCLVLSEGVNDPAEIARRAGYAHLAPSAAIRIINRARRIVAAG
jgi:hypothetical protein